MEFEVEEAIEYGVEEAAMLKNIRYWVIKNAANNRHFYDGRYWTYNSHKAFTAIFPFWTVKQIRRILGNLIKGGAIVTGNYNKEDYDQTLWYALSDKTLARLGKTYDQTGKPIPDNFKPDNFKPDIPLTPTGEQVPVSVGEEKSPNKDKAPETEGYQELLDYVNRKTNSRYRGDSKSRRNFAARIKDGYTLNEIKQAIDNATQNDYHKSKNFQYLTPEFICREDKLQMYLNTKQAPQTDFNSDEARRKRAAQAGVIL